MKKFQLLSIISIIAFTLNCSSFLSAQSLFTKSGSDLTWKQVNDQKKIPSASGGLTGSDIDVNQDHDEISSSPYKDRAIQNNIAIHTIANSTVPRSNFDKWTRWYQEDENTQVFRMFKGEINVGNDIYYKPRIEAELNAHSKGLKINNGADWVEWSGTYTFAEPVEANIFQIWSNDDYVLMLQMKNNGLVQLNPRDGSGFKNILSNAKGKSVDIRVRDYGNKYEVYVDGEYFYGRSYTAKKGNARAAHFRWGIYASRKKGDRGGVPQDGMLFVTGAQRKYSNDKTTSTPQNGNDKITSVTAPSSVQKGKTVAVKVNYSASTKRDILVMFQKDTKPFTVYKQERVSVNKGSGNKTINITIPSDTPVANNEYQFHTMIVPTGGNWNNRLDNENKNNVDVTNGGGSKISGTFYFKNRASGQYMDSEGDSNKSIKVNGKHKWADQHWKVVEVSNGNYNIIGVHGDRGCLDSQGGGQVIWSSVQSSSSKDRLWKLEDAGDGYYRFKNQFSNRGYLAKAHNSNKIEYTDWNGNRAQWKLEKVSSAKELLPEVATNTVKIYPNPATAFFTIDTGNDVASTLQVFNISGQMVLERVVSNVTTIPTDALGAGIYFVRVFNEDESDFYTEKLILK